MNTTKCTRMGWVIVLLAIINTPVYSQIEPSSMNSPLPPVQNQGQIEFLTGGIGLNESQAILQEGGKWPLMLELAKVGVSRAEYISDVQIIIKDASGSTMLETITNGPYLLAKLPPGKYFLDATYQGNTLRRELILQKEHKKITLLWPDSRTPE